MPLHAESHTFHEVRFLFTDTKLPNSTQGVVNIQNIISINLNRFHPVTNSFISERLTAKLFFDRRTQGVSVVFDDKYYRKIPYSSQIQRFMKITFRGSALTG